MPCRNAILGYDTGSHWLQHWTDSPQGLQGSRGAGESRETPKEVHQTDCHSSAGCPHCPGYSRTHHLPSSQAYNLVNCYPSPRCLPFFFSVRHVHVWCTCLSFWYLIYCCVVNYSVKITNCVQCSPQVAWRGWGCGRSLQSWILLSLNPITRCTHSMINLWRNCFAL